MRRHVVIVGSNGRIGSAVARRLAGRADLVVTALDRAALPLDDAAFIREKLSAMPIDLLINAAAITSVDACEEDPEAGWAVNAVAPGTMAEVCLEKGARMIHLSTDYVFSGQEPGERTEDETLRPLGEYGRSKFGGENKVLQTSAANLVLRTSWVFGSHRPSFPDMILDKARVGGVVDAISDKWSSPCYSEDFAAWLEVLLDRPEIGGVLHLCNSGACSWQEYGQAVLDIAGDLGVNLPVRSVKPMALADMVRFKAPRPIHSVMSCQRFTRLTGIHPRPWREALRDYLEVKLAANR